MNGIETRRAAASICPEIMAVVLTPVTVISTVLISSMVMPGTGQGLLQINLRGGTGGHKRSCPLDPSIVSNALALLPTTTSGQGGG